MLEARVTGGRPVLLDKCLFKLCRRFLFTMNLVAEIDPPCPQNLSYLVFWLTKWCNFVLYYFYLKHHL